MSARPRADSKTVSFRMTGPLLERLVANANATGRSVGESARDLLVSVLQDEARLEVLEEVRAAREDLRELRSDIAASLEAVLLNIAGKKKEDVRAYVSTVLRKQG